MKNNLLFKKLLFGLLFVVIGFLGVFYACNKRSVLVVDSLKDQSVKKDGLEKQVGISEEDDRVPKKLFLSDFMVIGEKHNEGLDFVLKKMVEARKAGKSIDDIRNVENLIDIVFEFVRQNYSFASDTDILKKNRSQFIEILNIIKSRGLRFYIQNNSMFNSVQKRYLFSLLDSKFNNYLQIKNNIEHLIKEVQNSDISLKEQYPLFAMASVALKSAEYWMEKKVLWDVVTINNISSVYDISDEKKDDEIDWKKVCIQDVCGAAGGASVAGGPGAVALAIAMSAYAML